MARYLIFGVVGMTLLILSLSSTAIAVAFPQITASFGVSIVLAGWVLTAFQMAMIVSIPLAGKASEALGRKRTLLFVVTLFTLGSFMCAIAPNIYWLIVSRAIQGMGAGGFATSAAGIIADTFPEKRQRYIGFITSILSIGTILGPNVGGWLTQALGWRSVFWAAIPWSIGAVAVSAVLIKPDGESKKVDFDVKGAGYFGLALVALMVGLTTLGNGGAKIPWLLVAVSLVVGCASC